jgi:hypothetical protein
LKSFAIKLNQFIDNDNVLLSQSPVVLAADFLQTAGKTTLLHQVFETNSNKIIIVFFVFFSRVNN